MQNDWRCLCSKQAIIERSKLYQHIRNFFNTRQVLEVETPLLAQATVTDPFIDSFEVFKAKDFNKSAKLYLQTSPEFYMKRLLCSGIGDIFQICKAFRSEENGIKHNAEFTMLEWYRLGFDLEDLMNEMTSLLTGILDVSQVIKYTYQDLFLSYLNFDYNLVDIYYVKNLLTSLFPGQFDRIFNGLDFEKNYTKDDLLNLLLSDYIEPQFPNDRIIFIYNYPPSQAALARVDNTGQCPVAKRFEVYFRGVELANGYYELADASEQAVRFKADLAKRQQLGFPQVTIDDYLIAGLAAGLPSCSGVALGLDRLLMLKLNKVSLDEVLAFR